jgi:branched-chain amino acid transport system ATP-binding protein
VTTGLSISGVTVRFGGNEALSDVDLEVPEGTITGLIGPNGAGKTTLFNVLCGLKRPLRGTVSLDDRDMTRLPPHRRARLGLARTFQRLETFTLLSVRDNVLAGAEFRERWADADEPPGVVADRLVGRLGLGDVAGERVDTLPTGRARIVELGRALAARPRMLLLDEPSSGLDERETEELGRVLRDLAADGPGILLVEHDMSLVMSVCSRISVLDFGVVIASGGPDEVRQDPVVRKAYLGERRRSRAAAGPVHPAGVEPTGVPDTGIPDTGLPNSGTTALEVEGLCAGYGDIDVVDGVDLTVARGEVFALLGPNGAGKTTVLKAVSGLLAPSAGSVRILGHDVTGADADALARAGLCTIPEGRGIFPNLTVAENLWMITNVGRSRSAVEESAYERFPRLAERRQQVAGTLSGGEQQMLSMARALACDPALLLLDELSMGLAPIIVGELYEEVGRLAGTGLTIVVVEQFAHEVLAIADRAAIMLHGSVGDAEPPAAIAARLESAYLTGSESGVLR